MGATSTIEWTDASWTPIRARNRETGKVGWHCEHATTGCVRCYSEGLNLRLGTGLPFKPGHRGDIELFLDETMLLAPLRWRKPRMIFVCSMTDLFADFVPDAWIDRVFAVMALCPQHTFQVLTKRSARMRAYVETEDRRYRIELAMCEIGGDYDSQTIPNEDWPLPNVWLGVSAERQQEADARIPDLLATPAAVRFLSAEPLLGPIDLYNGDPDPRLGGHKAKQTFIGDWWERGDDPKGPPRHGLDWIIVGGESGARARPMHPDWARSLRDQCASADVAFFFKQWGAWADTHPQWPRARSFAVANDGTIYRTSDLAYPDGARRSEALEAGHGNGSLTMMYRVGKEAAGRLLDGVTHDAMPASGSPPSLSLPHKGGGNAGAADDVGKAREGGA